MSDFTTVAESSFILIYKNFNTEQINLTLVYA